ncbi:MAG: hypothetical protein B5M56_05885 [Desulfococcus sp. 4484_241]|nr:MAG: hypothetical protein B5M56_05885 [Desulfococcus sp. 4484_241]
MAIQGNQISSFTETIKSMRDIIITNIVLTGQIPAPTFEEEQKAAMLLERFSIAGVDHCTTDGIGNPIGIIRGNDRQKPPIFVVAHLDTVSDKDVDHNYMVKKNTIVGPGVLDNSVGIGVLASLPDLFRGLGLSFDSDIVLAGVVRSIGKGNLEGIKFLLDHWKGPIRGAVCLEGHKLGRLSYGSEGLRRCEVECTVYPGPSLKHRYPPNAIIVLNEVINQILQMRFPLRPMTRVMIGIISGGLKHGNAARSARLGFEIQSDSPGMVKDVSDRISDILEGMAHEYRVNLKLKIISEQLPARLEFTHPLVKAALNCIKALRLEPVVIPSESELSAFLAKDIPAVTLGITYGEESSPPGLSKIRIDTMFRGIAQIVGVIKAIDSGVCDEQGVD